MARPPSKLPLEEPAGLAVAQYLRWQADCLDPPGLAHPAHRDMLKIGDDDKRLAQVFRHLADLFERHHALRRGLNLLAAGLLLLANVVAVLAALQAGWLP